MLITNNTSKTVLIEYFTTAGKPKDEPKEITNMYAIMYKAAFILTLGCAYHFYNYIQSHKPFLLKKSYRSWNALSSASGGRYFGGSLPVIPALSTIESNFFLVFKQP